MTPEIEDLKRDYESVKGANRIGQLNARDNYFWTKIGTLLAHIEQQEKRIGALTAENGSLKTVAFQAQEAAKDLAAQVERLGERHCIDCDTGECDVHE